MGRRMFRRRHYGFRRPDLSTHLAIAGRLRVQPLKTLRLLGRLLTGARGWGLTNDGNHIYMSDGSAQIQCFEFQISLRELRRITVMTGAAETNAERIGMCGRGDLCEYLAD